MSPENPKIEQNETLEQFPNQEEIKSVFETILKDKEFKELRVTSDEKGVSIYEVEITLENGEKVELNYQKAKYDYRDKSLPAGGQFSASIHATYYDKDGMPYNGECVANYLDGKWEYPS